MTTMSNATSQPAWWTYVLLGILLILIGLFLLGNVVAATIATTILIGAALLVAGAFQVVHAFTAKAWSGFFYHLAVGVIYLIAGVVLLSNPVAASFTLTLIFAGLLFASGVIRLVLAFQHWQHRGWLLALAGVVAILAGIVILTGWPVTGLWVIGFVVAIDLLVHGAWWLSFGFAVRRLHERPAA